MYNPITRTGDGSAPVVDITFDYLDRDHVKATVDGEAVTFTWTGASQITFDEAAPAASSVLVYRETPISAPLVEFEDSSVLTAEDLNLADTQLLYSTQELEARVIDGETAVLAAAQAAAARDEAVSAAATVPDYAVAAEAYAGASDTETVANAIAEAVSRGGNVPVFLDRTYTVTSFANDRGVQFVGPGKVIKDSQQLNSYADVPGRIVYGREYLFRVFQRALLGQSGSVGQIGAFLYGDSTVANGYMTSTTEDFLKGLFQARGVGNIAITNRGVAGTQVSDLNALPDLATTTDLLIIKYGINDGTNPEATRLETFRSTLDAKLTAIRAATNGSVGALAILLVGPNATGDTPNGRDERWYEQLRGVYVALARKHKAAYIDTYAAFRDPRGGAGLWLDDPYTDGRGIHPRDSLGYQIWSLVADTIITREEAVTLGTSNFRNLTNTVYLPAASALPTQWPFGITVARATVANGWPIEGFVITTRNPDQGTLQRLFPFAANNSRSLIRTANVGAGTFNRWTGAPEPISLSNGWANFGGGFANAEAVMLESGMVALRGMIASGTTAAGTVIGTLPAGMAPANDEIFEVGGNTTRVLMKVSTNGNVVLQSVGDAGFTSLSGIHFLAA